jgi:hypothetical protein
MHGLLAEPGGSHGPASTGGVSTMVLSVYVDNSNVWIEAAA